MRVPTLRSSGRRVLRKGCERSEQPGLEQPERSEGCGCGGGEAASRSSVVVGSRQSTIGSALIGSGVIDQA